MKAQVIEDYCFTPDFKLVELEKPSQLDDKQLLVKIKVVGLNRGDSLIRRGDAKLVFKFKMPCIMGLEGAGTIEAVGAGVTKFKIGDDVIVFLKNDRLGTTAEYTVCAEDDLVLKPNNMDFKQAAGVPTVTCTALEMFRSYSPISDVIKREIEHCKVHGKLTDAYEENDRQNVDILVIGASGGVGMRQLFLPKDFCPDTSTSECMVYVLVRMFNWSNLLEQMS
jgi:NADPH:quinone reductase-like Zn-dependent oxidoreductase